MASHFSLVRVLQIFGITFFLFLSKFTFFVRIKSTHRESTHRRALAYIYLGRLFGSVVFTRRNAYVSAVINASYEFGGSPYITGQQRLFDIPTIRMRARRYVSNGCHRPESYHEAAAKVYAFFSVSVKLMVDFYTKNFAKQIVLGRLSNHLKCG